MDITKPCIYPALRYRDAPAAIDFLQKAFGFTAEVVHQEGDVVHHAQLSWGSGMVMVGSISDGADGRHEGATGPAWIYVVVDDTDAHWERARAAGAEITEDPVDREYGSRDYAARDPEGHEWFFGTYQPAPGDASGG